MALSKLLFAEIDSPSGTSHTLIAAAASTRLIIVGLDLVLSSAQTLTLQLGSTPLNGDMPALSRLTYDIQTIENSYVERWRSAENEAFTLTTGGAATVDGVVWYLTE